MADNDCIIGNITHVRWYIQLTTCIHGATFVSTSHDSIRHPRGTRTSIHSFTEMSDK